MSGKVDSDQASGRMPEYLASSVRHFCDLRDGTHGDAAPRDEKEHLFEQAVDFLNLHARTVLDEINAGLLAGTGRVVSSGFSRSPEGAYASWQLSWSAQRARGAEPLTLIAHYGRGFHHPHLRGGTVGEWPLNVFSPGDAITEIPVLRAIAVAELHNLVFRHDYRIVPAVTRPPEVPVTPMAG